MKINDAFPSRYMKAADLKGRAVVVEIQDAVAEPLKGLDGKTQTKTVLYFKNKKKSMPLNRTNFLAVAKATGEEDSDDWHGHKIELYPTTTQMAGEEVECIRIRQPSAPRAEKPTTPPKSPPADQSNDEIPF